MAISPISNVEITAWAEGMRINLLPFERKALRAIDKAYIIHCISKDKSNGE